MHIIIDGVIKYRSAQYSRPDFLKNFLLNWIAVFPEDRLSVITNNDESFSAIPQVKIYPVAEKKNVFSRNNIFGHTLPSLVAELKADIFFSPFLNTSSKISIPQVLSVSSDIIPAINDLPFLKRWLVSTALKKQIVNAGQIIFSSFFLKNRINSLIQLPEEKTAVVYENVHQNVSGEQISNQETRENYTDGREYFLYIDERSESQAVINMLRGFSAFKKRQQTNMMLMFAGSGSVDARFRDMINTYKFRDSICITNALNEKGLGSVRSAAYAAVFPLLNDGSESEMIASAAAGIPVLCADIPAYRKLEIFSPLYFNPEEPDDINKQMAFIFKNENKRWEIVQQCSSAAAKFNWTARVTGYREIFRKLL